MSVKRSKQFRVILENHRFGISGYRFVSEEDSHILLTSTEKYGSNLNVYRQKGIVCCVPACGVVGSRLIKGRHHSGKIGHFLFTDSLIKMTVDHIIPLAMGGSNNISNFQPMCQHCNSAKADLIISNDDLGKYMALSKKERVIVYKRLRTLQENAQKSALCVD